MAHSPKAAGRSDPALAHYEVGPDLSGVVLEALPVAGRPVDPLDPDDLAGLDEFHGLGRAATLTMADLARISEGERVLDVGAGIGGPARTLAAHLGARVTALDPTRRFCDLNEELCRRTRLDDKVEVVCGDAREMPIDDGQFDVAWTQAVWPNVDDKEAMLSEMHRVLKPDGRLALHEVVSSTAGGDRQYPLPWANGARESFLVSAQELRRLIESAGFVAREWLEPPDLIARIGEIVGSGHPGMVTGGEGMSVRESPDAHARRLPAGPRHGRGRRRDPRADGRMHARRGAGDLQRRSVRRMGLIAAPSRRQKRDPPTRPRRR
jgi:SAM-dependent methyltransferase